MTDIENKLVELVLESNRTTSKQADTVEKVTHSNSTMFQWFCITLIIITIVWCATSALNTYNACSFSGSEYTQNK